MLVVYVMWCMIMFVEWMMFVVGVLLVECIEGVWYNGVWIDFFMLVYCFV